MIRKGTTATFIVSGACLALAVPAWAGTAAGTAVSAGTAPRWGPVAEVASTRARSVEVAVDPAGDATAVWTTRSGALRASHRPAGGNWHRKVDLGAGYVRDAGADGAGAVTAVFVGTGNRPRLWAVRRSAAGRWKEPVALSERAPWGIDTDCGGGIGFLDLEVARGGSVLVAWQWGSDDCRPIELQAAYRPEDADWESTRTLHVAEHADSGYEVDGAVDRKGDALITYIYRDSSQVDHELYARRHLRPSPWTLPTLLRDGQNHDPRLGLDRAGDATAVWWSTSEDALLSASRPHGQKWGTASVVPVTGLSEAETTALAVAEAGDVTLAWGGRDFGIHAVLRDDGGTWGEPVGIAPAGRGSRYLWLTSNAGGDTALIWERGSDLRVSVRPAEGTWSAKARLRGVPEASTGMDDRGRTLFVWISDQGHVMARWLRS